ncbi:putative endo-rhamnogalacturonase f [Phaeomoniella chlamydospora]|uniref:Putative endo-rhamnogalacturonase f n=1 Tax=Phaeomoniella chlamydospora TaxID=158046 RepID=A0A0G2GVC9_PHACM|nr:putative endo-rhamnogalacturonase f [Phaeomoniella chlamydospora]
MNNLTLLLRSIVLLTLVFKSNSQLIGPIGPTTPLANKTVECNILDYGAIGDNSTNVAPAIYAAYNRCVLTTPGSRLLVPNGTYLLEENVVLSNGTNWAFQLDGLITASYNGNWSVPRELILQGYAGVEALNSTINGEGDGLLLLDVLVIVNAVDFEFYSSNGFGAIQGQGYLYRNANNTERPRVVRLISPINASIHDLLLIDSPKFHFVFDFGVNIEVYHLTIRGGNLGSYDGIDAIGTNYYIHDNEGNNIGFIKTYPGGSGYVTNVTFENIRSKASLYGLDVNQYWQNTFTPDTGAVQLENLVFNNFTGSVANGANRPPLYLIGNDLKITQNVTIKDFSLWTENGDFVVNHVNNIYGTGDDVYGPNDGLGTLPSTSVSSLPTFTSTITVTTSPSGWVEPTLPTWAVASTGYGTAVPIPVYTPPALWKPQGDYDKHYWGSF